MMNPSTNYFPSSGLLALVNQDGGIMYAPYFMRKKEKEAGDTRLGVLLFVASLITTHTNRGRWR